MFKLNSKVTISDSVRGIFATPILYEVRVPDGDWTPYFGKYQNQKWAQWDSDSCWCLSAINCAEDQLEWLRKNSMFSSDAIHFFIINGYIDEDGDFSLSERFLEILGGVKDAGNNQMEAWVLMQAHGCIPRSMLTYTSQRAGLFKTQETFNDDYFNLDAVTPEMIALGKQFKTYVNIARQWIGTAWKTPPLDVLRSAIKQAPLQIGFPVPRDISLYNNILPIPYDGKVSADHAVEMYKIQDDGKYNFFDQYIPNFKTLDSSYYLPFVSQGILTATQPQVVNLIPQDTRWNRFWSSVMHWYNGIPDSTPVGNYK